MNWIPLLIPFISGLAAWFFTRSKLIAIVIFFAVLLVMIGFLGFTFDFSSFMHIGEVFS